MLQIYHLFAKPPFFLGTVGLLVIIQDLNMLNDYLDFISHWLKLNMKGFTNNLIGFIAGNFLIYAGTGAFFHWHYYINQRKLSNNWKCQPLKWLPPHIELFELLLGLFNIFCGSTLGASLATYILNNGSATLVYFQCDAYGYFWLIFQIPITFAFVDYLYYWHHRLYHLPWFYKRFHKIHHMFKQPTSFAVVAFHPFEQFTEHLVIFSPMFLFPVYWFNMLVIYLYMYLHGILGHSGINFKNFWWQPWQADAKYHDLHHEHTHYNFTFNIVYWDKLHGTIWQNGNKIDKQ